MFFFVDPHVRRAACIRWRHLRLSDFTTGFNMASRSDIERGVLERSERTTTNFPAPDASPAHLAVEADAGGVAGTQETYVSLKLKQLAQAARDLTAYDYAR